MANSKRFGNRGCGAEFAQRNFAFSFEINHLANGKRDRVVRMTKDGFMLLAMGFTGPKAMAMKVAFINAFNAMAEQLQQIEQRGFQARRSKPRR